MSHFKSNPDSTKAGGIGRGASPGCSRRWHEGPGKKDKLVPRKVLGRSTKRYLLETGDSRQDSPLREGSACEKEVEETNVSKTGKKGHPLPTKRSPATKEG